MINLMIDGEAIAVEEGTTILEAARRLNVHIPTLCHHEDQAVKAVCRICVVEVEGQRLLPTACSMPVSEGMVVKTASPKVIKARKNIMELILARHPQDCLVCSKNGKCQLQKVARDLNMNRPNRYERDVRESRFDDSSPSIVRDMSKCILCGRCMESCGKVQGIQVMAKENRGFHTEIVPPYGKELVDTSCVGCGQCVQVCPVGALSIRDNTDEVYRQMAAGKTMVIQMAPSVRINLAEALGQKAGTVSTGKIVHALKKIGFDKVFDSDFSADLTIMEEAHEFLDRVQNGGVLPLITSCSPGWIKYCEHYFPDMTENLSSCKSPQQMFGAIAKSYYAEKMHLDPKNIVSVSIMPCTAKKFEIQRPNEAANGVPDVDYSLTTRELARMIRKVGLKFNTLPDEEYDAPLGLGTGAAVIFGATGGVMEAALRTAVETLTGEELQNLDFTDVRGMEGIKEATYPVAGLEVKVAIASGLGNAKKLLEKVKSGEADYHFIEIMGCPGGCINGGGQPQQPGYVRNTVDIRGLRAKVLYDSDKNNPIRKSHENPAIKELYATFLGEPGSQKAHHLLHTTYVKRKVNEI